MLQRVLVIAAAGWLSLLTPRPEYAALFAPAGPRAAAYQFYVSGADLPSVLRSLASEPSLLRPPGAWTPTALLPADAFGETGAYDRAKMARLYGSKRALVARGPSTALGTGPSTLGTTRPAEAWTLVSPYPSPDLSHLEPGTLLIVLRLP